MCQRKSAEEGDLSQMLIHKDQKIKQLINEVDQVKDQLEAKTQELNSLAQIKESVRKIPYNIYKDFIIVKQMNGDVINLLKKKSSSLQSSTLSKQSSVNKIPQNATYQNYLLLKINGQRPSLYMSQNTQISPIQKLNLNKLFAEQRKSYEFKADLQQNLEKKRNSKLKIVNNLISYRINQNPAKQKKAQLSQQHKKLLMFPPRPSSPSASPQLRKKQSLPLKTECQILSDDLKKLRERINEYTKVISDKSLPQNISSNESNDGKPSSKSKQKLDSVSQINFQSLLKENKQKAQSRWKQQKQKYIEYIAELEKQLKGYRNYNFSFADKGQEVHSQKRVQDYAQTFSVSQVSESKSAQQKFNIFKPSDQQSHKSFYKNQYHVNDLNKSRSKSKNSKVFYLGRS